MSTTDKLLDAAEYRMRRGGYNAVSFRDLASDTKIKSSSVHYHYPRKEDLGVALIERYAERFFDALAKEAGQASTQNEKLMAFRAVYRSALIKDDAICLCGLLGAELAGLPAGLSDGIQAFFNANIAWVEDALSEDLSDDEKHVRASGIVAAHQGAMMLSTSLQDKDLFDRITDQAINAVAHGA